MGTSSDHSGGSGTAWNAARASGRNWAEAGGGQGPGLVRLVTDAITALAGYEGASASAAAAPALARIGGLASGPGTPPGETLNQALVRNGLDDLTGRPPADIHAALVDFIAGEPDDRDAALIRDAADEAVADLLDNAADLDALVIDADTAERIALRFLSEWLTRLITRELGTTLVDVSAAQAEQRSAEIRDYVTERLTTLRVTQPLASIDWRTADGTAQARAIVDGAREVFAE